MSEPSQLNLTVTRDEQGSRYLHAGTLDGFLRAVATSEALTGEEAETVLKVADLIQQAMYDGEEDRPIRLDWN